MLKKKMSLHQEKFVEFDIKPELGDEEDIEEISTSAGAGAYMTKAAFKPKYGYKLVKKKSKKDS
jgi:hypothetical protein